MTAIVAACFKHGVLIGSESRAVLYSQRHGAIVSESSDKIASLKSLSTVLGFAGEVNLTSTFLPTNDKIRAMSLPEFLIIRMLFSRESSVQSVKDCIKKFVDILTFVQEKNERTIDVVFGLGPAPPQTPTLFRFCAKGPPWASRKIEPNVVCMGAGVWDHYYAAASDRKKFFVNEERERLAKLKSGGLVTPPLPAAIFETREAAEKWVRSVISWCCTAFPMYCSGLIKITDSNSDLFKFSND